MASIERDLAEHGTDISALRRAVELQATEILLMKEGLKHVENKGDHLEDIADVRAEIEPFKERINQIEERIDSLIVLLDQFARSIITWHLHHDPKERL